MTIDRHPFITLKARLLLFWIVISSIVAWGVQTLLQQSTGRSPQDPIWMSIIYDITMVVPSYLVCRHVQAVKGNFDYIFGTIPRSLSWPRLGGLIVANLLVSIGGVLFFIYGLYQINPDWFASFMQELDDQALVQPTTSTMTRLTIWLTVVVVASITEELLFRGVLLQRWGSRWGARAGLILSSIVFGVLHLNVIGASIFGLLVGTLYIQTRSLGVVIAVHAANNFIASFGIWFSDDSPAKSTPESIEAMQTSLGAGGSVGLFLLIVGAPWLIRYFRKNFPDRHTLLPYWSNQQARLPH